MQKMWGVLPVIKWLICLLWGHDLAHDEKLALSREYEFKDWTHAYCRRCGKYRKL